MANSSATFREVRFIFQDELTQVYVLIEAGGDSPLGVQGWHHKTYPASISAMDILRYMTNDDPVLWPQAAPEQV